MLLSLFIGFSICWLSKSLDNSTQLTIWKPVNSPTVSFVPCPNTLSFRQTIGFSSFRPHIIVLMALLLSVKKIYLEMGRQRNVWVWQSENTKPLIQIHIPPNLKNVKCKVGENGIFPAQPRWLFVCVTADFAQRMCVKLHKESQLKADLFCLYEGLNLNLCFRFQRVYTWTSQKAMPVYQHQHLDRYKQLYFFLLFHKPSRKTM